MSLLPASCISIEHSFYETKDNAEAVVSGKAASRVAAGGLARAETGAENVTNTFRSSTVVQMARCTARAL